jgi:hypothetical protein
MSRLRKRLAKMIEEALLEHGIEATVDPNDLDPATGWYRTSPQADCYRWEGFAKYKDPALSIQISVNSYTTMSQIVKSGKATLSPDRVYGKTSFDVYDATGN